MDYNRNWWNLRFHPVWNAFLNNPSYYYYCSAKAALLSQSGMVRKNGNGNTTVAPRNALRPLANASSTPSMPVPPGGNGVNDVLKQFGVQECPECKSALDLNDNRPLREFCGHIRCRRCLIKSANCLQCIKPPPLAVTAKKSVPNGTVSLPVQRPDAPQVPTRTYPPHSRSGSLGTGFNVTKSGGLPSHSGTVAPSTSTSSISRFSTANMGQKNGSGAQRLQTTPTIKVASVIPSSSNQGTSKGTLLFDAMKVSNGPSNGMVSTSSPVKTTAAPPSVLEMRSVVHYPSDMIIHTDVPQIFGRTTDTGTTAVSGSSSMPIRHPSSSSNSNPLPSGSSFLEGSDSGDDSRGKKKKKRSPVVIHDHITVISGDPTMFQCNVCMKKFKTKAHIKYHEFCQNGEKPFKCEECGQGFIAKSHYEYHLRTHTGERPYTCPKCGKGFNQRGKVTRHMRSHTGEKPFVCSECNRGFANAQALRSHHLIHTGERPYACKYCNKRFTGMTNLKKHIITHTGERPYVCSHCGKSFGLKWTLDLHLRTHSSERPYACDQCTRAFSNSKDLRRHLVIHSGERPFKCWICGTAFRRKDNLDRHIKNTHNQPKEVAKKLANDAAAEYLLVNEERAVPASKVNSAVISKVIRTAQLNAPPAKSNSDSPTKKIKKFKLLRKVNPAVGALPTVPENLNKASEAVSVHSNKQKDLDRMVNNSDHQIETVGPHCDPEKSCNEDLAKDQNTNLVVEEPKSEEDLQFTNKKEETSSHSPEKCPELEGGIDIKEESGLQPVAENKDELTSKPTILHPIEQTQDAVENSNLGNLNPTDCDIKIVDKPSIISSNTDRPPTPELIAPVENAQVDLDKNETFDNENRSNELDTERSDNLDSEDDCNFFIIEKEEMSSCSSEKSPEKCFSPELEDEVNIKEEKCPQSSSPDAESKEEHPVFPLIMNPIEVTQDDEENSNVQNPPSSDCDIKIVDKLSSVSSMTDKPPTPDLIAPVEDAPVDLDKNEMLDNEGRSSEVEAERSDNLDSDGNLQFTSEKEELGSYSPDRCFNPEFVDDVDIKEGKGLQSPDAVAENSNELPIYPLILHPIGETQNDVENSKVRNLTPSDCGIRLFDRVASSPTMGPHLGLASMTYLPDDEEMEHIFVDEKETQTVLEEFNADACHNLKIIIGRAKHIYDETQSNGRERTPSPQQLNISVKSEGTPANFDEDDQSAKNTFFVHDKSVNEETDTDHNSPFEQERAVTEETDATFTERTPAGSPGQDNLQSTSEKEELSSHSPEKCFSPELEDEMDIKEEKWQQSKDPVAENNEEPPACPLNMNPIEATQDDVENSNVENLTSSDCDIKIVDKPSCTSSTAVGALPTVPENMNEASEAVCVDNNKQKDLDRMVNNSDHQIETVGQHCDPEKSCNEDLAKDQNTNLVVEEPKSEEDLQFTSKKEEVSSHTPERCPELEGGIDKEEKGLQPVAENKDELTSKSVIRHPIEQTQDAVENSNLGNLNPTDCDIKIVDKPSSISSNTDRPPTPEQIVSGENAQVDLDQNETFDNESRSNELERSDNLDSEDDCNFFIIEKEEMSSCSSEKSPEKCFSPELEDEVDIKEEKWQQSKEPVAENDEACPLNMNPIEATQNDVENSNVENLTPSDCDIKIVDKPSSTSSITNRSPTPELLLAVEEAPVMIDEPRAQEGRFEELETERPRNDDYLAQFYYQENPHVPYSESGFYPSQITIDHPYVTETGERENVDFVYASATAQAERNSDENGPPVKIRLLHAEALGFGPQQSGGQSRLYYSATRPDQVIPDYRNPSVALAPPAVIHASGDDSGGRPSSTHITVHSYMFDRNAQNRASEQYPINVSYDRNGVIRCQSISAHSNPAAFIQRAQDAYNMLPQAAASYSSHNNHSVRTSQYEYNAYYNSQQSHQQSNFYKYEYYNTVPTPPYAHQSTPAYHSQPQQIPHASSYSSSCNYGAPQSQPIDARVNVNMNESNANSQDGNYALLDNLESLAAAAALRMKQNEDEQKELEATIATAAAIAKVGEAARRQREEELKLREMRRLELENRLQFHEQSRRKTPAARKSYY